jgi:hypothetical protein
MNKKQIEAIEALKDAADNARKLGLSESQINEITKPDVKIDQILGAAKRAPINTTLSDPKVVGAAAISEFRSDSVR